MRLLIPTNYELHFIPDAIRQTVVNAEKWNQDYCYDRHTKLFQRCTFIGKDSADFNRWFTLA